MSWVPQSAQNCLVSGFSEWHFGHFMAAVDPFYQVWQKAIKDQGASQLKIDLSIAILLSPSKKGDGSIFALRTVG
jgi:hypothetical protein